MNTTIVVAKQEKPLSAPAKLGLMAGLALLNLLLYLFGILALIGIGLLILLDLVLLLGLARIYAARSMIAPLQRLARLSRVLVGSFKLEEGARYHMPLTEPEAPHLFSTVRRCAERVGCIPPSQIVLEMSNGAWVRLEGYRSGRGKSVLGLGLELLVTMPQAEIEAILFHEMAHALRVQRGLNNATRKGVWRGSQLAEGAEDLENEERQRFQEQGRKNGPPFWSARIIGKVAGAIARAESKLFAIYSRQDEFEADRIAAELCGIPVFRNALLNSILIGIKAGDLRWQDRLMQSQREGSYTEWLRGKLLPEHPQEAARLRKEAFDSERRSPFSTHPTLQDRLAQVGADFPWEATPTAAVHGPMPATPMPGYAGRMPFAPTLPTMENQSTGEQNVLPCHAPVAWFTDADGTAERLLTALERIQAEQERKNSEELIRLGRQHGRRSRALTALEWGGVFLIVVGVLCLVCLLGALDQPGLAALLSACGVGGIIGGIVVCREGAPPPPMPLPLPDYTVWEDSLEAIWERIRLKQPAPSGGAMIPGPPPNARKADMLVHWRNRGYEALLHCDFPSALTCGLQCLSLKAGYTEGLLLAGIGYNCLGQEQAGDNLLRQAMTSYRFNPSVNWAASWACLAAGEWTGAELYLLKATEQTGKNEVSPGFAPTPTLLGALAKAQAQRGKLRATIDNLQKAVGLAPRDFRLRLRLAQALLTAGKAREAAPHLEMLIQFPNAFARRDLRLGIVRMHLLLGRKAEADLQAQLAVREHPDPETRLRLGISYFKTDHLEPASEYFHQATATALYPAAWIHLGAIYAKTRRKNEARACYLGAVNMLAPRVPDADKPLDALSSALDGLREVREKTQPLFPWAVTLNLRMLPVFDLADLHLLILAPNRNGAIAYAEELYMAMHPGGPPLQTLLVSAEKTDMDPPEEAVEPGIVDWRARTA